MPLGGPHLGAPGSIHEAVEAMMAARRQQWFVLNQLGQSAHRKGAFESREAALEWAKRYGYPSWIVAAEPAGDQEGLNADGE